MTKHDTLTPSTSLRVPRTSFTVPMYGSLAALPRLVSVAIVSVSTFLASASVAAAQAQSELHNPLNSQFSSIPNFIAGFLKVLVMVALPIISLMIVVAGFQFVLAQGNDEKLGKAKQNFLYVVLGATLILGAWVIATLIGGTVNQLTNG